MGDSFSVLQSTSSSPSSSHVVQVHTLPKILDHWGSLTFNRFVLNIVKVHHPQLMWNPPLFHNFKWFNITAARSHHPIIQKEVGGLLAKGAIEPSMDGDWFYSKVFVVPMNTGSL